MSSHANLHPALAGRVREIRIDEPDTSPSAEPFKVLPTPFPVLGMQLRGRLEVLRGERPELLSVSGITGLQSAYRYFRPGADTRSVLVIFEPFGVFALLGCPMRELSDEHVGLAALLPPAAVAEMEERASSASSAAEVSGIVQSFLLKQLGRARRPPHPGVVAAARRIVRHRGLESIETLSREIGVGRRHLERLFTEQIGTGPKDLASLARFDWVVHHIESRRSWADLASEAGYADQAHLIRSFSARAGISPGEHARGAR
jgi:AraC-like DNA-binding protein